MYLFVAVLGIIAALSLSPLVVGRQSVTAVILRLDAPRSCRSDRRVLFGPKERDSIPSGTEACCGVVITDHGGVRLPESNRFSFGLGTRENMYDLLQEGCAFDLQVSGWGFRLEPGGLPWDRNNKVLRSAHPIRTCAD
jgi:hypothetical protein